MELFSTAGNTQISLQLLHLKQVSFFRLFGGQSSPLLGDDLDASGKQIQAAIKWWSRLRPISAPLLFPISRRQLLNLLMIVMWSISLLLFWFRRPCFSITCSNKRLSPLKSHHKSRLECHLQEGSFFLFLCIGSSRCCLILHYWDSHPGQEFCLITVSKTRRRIFDAVSNNSTPDSRLLPAAYFFFMYGNIF